jgi:5-methyltetrahydrofolate--homocysteine methyltransferase
MDLTESFQLLPEQSTAAVIIHHPEAKYYAVRGTGAGASSEPEAAVA